MCFCLIYISTISKKIAIECTVKDYNIFNKRKENQAIYLANNRLTQQHGSRLYGLRKPFANHKTKRKCNNENSTHIYC